MTDSTSNTLIRVLTGKDDKRAEFREAVRSLRYACARLGLPVTGLSDLEANKGRVTNGEKQALSMAVTSRLGHSDFHLWLSSYKYAINADLDFPF